MQRSCLYSAIAVSVVAVLFVPIAKEDSAALTTDEIECGQMWAYLTFENSIEKALIRSIAVTHKDGDSVFASAYTFGGIRIGQVEANCSHGSARRI